MFSSGKLDEVLRDQDYPWVLVAYGMGDPRELPYRPGLMLDSGAFSAWTVGKAVNVHAYATFATELLETYGAEVHVLNLDVIPGEPGRPPTDRERTRAVSESAANAEILRDAGLPVIEVYHLYEPLDVFGSILDRRRPGELVALGGMVFALTKRSTHVRAFCDSAFAFARDAYGWGSFPPIHGLGVSGDSPTAQRYPWYSVDSIAWMAKNINLEVDSSGRFRHRGSAGRPRTDAATMLYAASRLRRWQRFQTALTSMWTDRGVSHAR